VLKSFACTSVAISIKVSMAASIAIGPAHASNVERPPSLAKVCHGATMKITCSPANANCVDTKLTLLKRDGAKVNPAKPKGLEKYTAVGLTCTYATDGTPYFLVDYGERPRGCEFCEWTATYDINGKVLTSNDPPILHDPSRPPAKQDYPNNEELNALFKKLGLKKVNTEYLP